MPVVSVPRITPLSLIVTTPLDTEKLSVLKEATPLFVLVASSPVTVTLLFDTVTFIPSPSEKVSVSFNKLTASVLAASSVIFKLVAILTGVTLVSLPCASTVKVGIDVVEPYVPGDTVVLSNEKSKVPTPS